MSNNNSSSSRDKEWTSSSFIETKPSLRIAGAHAQIVYCILQLSDNTLLTGSADGTLKRWSLADGGSLLACFDCRNDGDGVVGGVQGGGMVTVVNHVRCMVELNETLVAVGYSDGVIRIWNLLTSEYRCLVHLPHTEINCFVVLKHNIDNDDNKKKIRIAAGSRKVVKIWTEGEETPVLLPTNASVRTLCELRSRRRRGRTRAKMKRDGGEEDNDDEDEDEDGGLLVTGDSEGMLEFWNTTTQRSVHKMKAHTGWVNCLLELNEHGDCKSGDGDGGSGLSRVLASGSADDKIRLWCVRTKQLLRTIKHEDLNYVSSLVQLSHGLVVTGSLDDLILAWNARGDLVQTYPAQGPVSSVVLLRDESIAYILNSTDLEIRRSWNRKSSLVNMCCYAIAMRHSKSAYTETIQKLMPYEIDDIFLLLYSMLPSPSASSSSLTSSSSSHQHSLSSSSSSSSSPPVPLAIRL
eukprot:TRINITY_DN2344_c0_g1_i1.p1 TRINITY_DN2344_c0_g1~~TRINITY_DN2344_c0_g1_i1.p1  ORF type:complete len:464 (-),score=114.29 TRINITY_DN2344_c0_g1_i1:310-1701(-)